MWKYIRLNLFVISKRVSTWLIPIFFIITLFCVTGLVVMLDYRTYTEAQITQTDKKYLVLPFIMMIAFVSTKVLNIFKDPEDDGTELMVASKPITRVKIIFGKFLTLYILIALFSFATFIFSLLIAQADKLASTKDVLTFSLSMGFGTWIISMLLSVIIIFFSSIMGKIGTIVCSLMVPLIFALTSTTVLLMTQQSLASAGARSSFVQNTYITQDDKIITKQGTPQFVPDSKGTPSASDNERRYGLTLEQAYTKHTNNWYQYAAYADVWTQLTTFYSIFNTNKPSVESNDWKYRAVEEVPASSLIDPEFLVKVKRHAYEKVDWKAPDSSKPFTDSNGDLITATIPYALNTYKIGGGYGPDGKNEVEALKKSEKELTAAKKIYNNFDKATKRNITNLFNNYATEYTKGPDSTDWDDTKTATQNGIFKAIPDFFGTELMNELMNSAHTKSMQNTTRQRKNILMSYLVLRILKDKSVYLSADAKSVLFSEQTFTEKLTPIGINSDDWKSKHESQSKSSASASVYLANDYDSIIFASKTPFKEATVKKLVPSKYVPDLLVYLAWPAITILLSALIILKYMKRDFK